MAGDTTATPPGTGFGGTAGSGATGTGAGAQDKAQQAAGQAKEQATQVAGQAQEKAQEVAGQAKEQASQAAGQAKSRAREQVDQRSTQAGEQVSSQASDIRELSKSLREQGKDKPAQYVDQAADRLEGLGDYLKQADADKLLHDLEDFGRQRPTAILAGGLALGFLASRFLKASASQRYETRYSASPQGLPTSYDRPAGITPAPGAAYGTTGLSAGGASDLGTGTGTGAGAGTLSSGVVDTGAATRTGQPVDALTETERARTGAGTESGIPLPPTPDIPR